jgi:Mg2+ and Co2+ transporter CorA
MNFHLPFFDDPNGFLLVVGIMTGVALVILVVARAKRWI